MSTSPSPASLPSPAMNLEFFMDFRLDCMKWMSGLQLLMENLGILCLFHIWSQQNTPSPQPTSKIGTSQLELRILYGLRLW